MAEGHVEQLSGSEFAKARLRILLRTMQGTMTVPEACTALSICESRFHALRHAWLQAAVELLEPRRSGRHPSSERESPEVQELRRQLRAALERAEQAETREEVAQILHLPEPPRREPGKKTDLAAARRGARRRRRQQLARRNQRPR